MAYSFSNIHADRPWARRAPAPGMDREAVHRIRQQGRIERAKVVRRCFAALGRFAVGAHTGGSLR